MCFIVLVLPAKTKWKEGDEFVQEKNSLQEGKFSQCLLCDLSHHERPLDCFISCSYC